MKLRDIDESEVLEALALARSSLGPGKTKLRETSRGDLRVVYERPAPKVVLVITTYQESN